MNQNSDEAGKWTLLAQYKSKTLMNLLVKIQKKKIIITSIISFLQTNNENIYLYFSPLIIIQKGETSEWEPKFSPQEFIRLLNKKSFRVKGLIADFLQFLVSYYLTIPSPKKKKKKWYNLLKKKKISFSIQISHSIRKDLLNGFTTFLNLEESKQWLICLNL